MKSLILSDVHANLVALEAILVQEGSWDAVIVLGDVVVAGPYPNEVLSLLSDLDGVCAFVMGNHDLEMLDTVVAENEMDSHKLWTKWTQEQVSGRNREFLASFPETCVLHHQALTLRLIHGVLPSEWGKRLWPDSSPAVFNALARRYPEPYILVGHSHVQFMRTQGGTTFVNPGTVGAPYLGQPLACYGVLQDGEVSLRAASYDVERVCRAMDSRVPLEDRGFVEAWKTCWRTGRLPPRYDIRDYAPLIEAGYR